MARKDPAGKMVRAAEGVYRRNGAYVFRVAGKWHSQGCGPECGHDRIVDLRSAKAAKTQVEQQNRARWATEETVAEWAERWLAVFPRKQQSTNIHNAERVRAFVRDFGSQPLRALAEDPCWAWAREHPSSVKEVRAMLSDAETIRLIDRNPLKHFRVPDRRGRRDIQTLTVDELDLLLDCALEAHGDFGPVMAAMIETAAFTGVRPGELFAFSRHAPTQDFPRVNVVDFKAGVVRVDWQWNAKVHEVTRPKWDSVRVVVLLPRAVTALRSVPDYGPGPLFRTKREKPYTGRTHHYYWDRVRTVFAQRLPEDHWLKLRMADARRQGRQDDLDFYELRHFFGTSLAHPPAGIRPASPYEIMQQMGHKDMKVTMRYLHSPGVQVSADLRDAWKTQAPRRRAS